MSNEVVIALGGEGSGSFATWDHFKLHNNKVELTRTSPLGGMEAISSVLNNKIDAFLFVTSGKYELLYYSDIFKTVINSPELYFIPIDNYRLFFDSSDRFHSYHMKNIVIKKAFFNTRLKTICMESNVIINTQLPQNIKDIISKSLISLFRENQNDF